MHERVHDQQAESRAGVVVARGLRIRSLELGLAGQADVVEFHAVGGEQGVVLPGRRGKWMPLPVEYKRGVPKKDMTDAVQLCAQALCLEEMLDVEILRGCLYYGKTRRRSEVVLDDPLREATYATASRVREMIESRVTPPAVLEGKCRRCSLRAVCVPEGRRGAGYVVRQVRAALRNVEEDA